MAVFMTSGGTRPKRSTFVNYIASSGAQYIDTGFKLNQNTRVVMDCQAYSVDSGGSFPFGVRAGLNSKAFTVALTESQVFYNYASAYKFADFSGVTERMTIDANKNVATFKGSTTTTITLDSGTFTCDSNLLIATASNGGVAYTGAAAWVGAIYSCQIYDNGTLIRDFVPAIDSNGEVCLYDKVNEKYYYNAGTGKFIGG